LVDHAQGFGGAGDQPGLFAQTGANRGQTTVFMIPARLSSSLKKPEPTMPRRARIALPNVPVHLIQRGNNRQPCFFAD